MLNNYAYYLALENMELEKALEMSARTLRDEPDELIYVDTYAWILFLLERYDEAKLYADKLMAGDSAKAPWSTTIAATYMPSAAIWSVPCSAGCRRATTATTPKC